MNIPRFVANLNEARNNASTVIGSKNIVARMHASDILMANIDNMIEELDTIINIREGKIDKDALLKSLLEDAESVSKSFSYK